MITDPFPIFLVSAPGLETVLAEEARAIGFSDARAVRGGVEVSGGWPAVWRANLLLRGATRVLVRIAQFRVGHLAQLDKRGRAVDWQTVLRPDVPFKVEASCRKSKIYHSGAARERIERAISETLGAPLSDAADVRVLVRIENDLCTVSVDSSGEGLYRRGHKLEVNKAPMRETLAALFLRQCGYRGTEPVLDPMCGSGTLVIEAAEMALGLMPGRARSFAFEHLAPFDPPAWARLRENTAPHSSAIVFRGSDRDGGAVRMSKANAERAGVGSATQFVQCAIADLQRPEGAPGLVIVNPPYGLRIGDRNKLQPLYATFGQVMRTRFSRWRVGLVTADPKLAAATGLAFEKPGESVDNNGVRITLYRTGILP